MNKNIEIELENKMVTPKYVNRKIVVRKVEEPERSVAPVAKESKAPQGPSAPEAS